MSATSDSEEPPEISVVIPARDAGRHLGETLRSLLAQTESRFEAVIVDDGSSDDTAEIASAVLRTDERFRLVSGTCTGVSAARNTGWGETGAPFVLFLDADDVLVPDALARMKNTLSPGDAVAALGGVGQITESGLRLPGGDNRDLVPESEHLAALLRKNFVVNGGALMIRRSSIEAIGGYDPELSYGEDWEFWCRLAGLGDFNIVPGGPVLMYRQRATGANHRAMGSLFASDMACLRKVAQAPAIRRKLGRRLPRLLRARRIDIFWSGVRNEYRHGSRGRALRAAAAGLCLFPDSLARPGLALRFLRSLVR